MTALTASPKGVLADEVGAEHNAPRAVVAVDGGRPLTELEIGNRRERNGGARGRRDLELLQELPAFARLLVELHADRHLAVADVELGEVGANVADGGDTDGLGDRLRGHAELRGELGLRIDAQLGAVQLGRRDDVGDHRNAPRLARQVRADLVDGLAIATGDDELELALAVILHEPEADVGLGRECAADLLLDLPLAELALILRHQVEDEGCLAHLLAAPQEAAAVDKYALHVAALLYQAGDLVRQRPSSPRSAIPAAARGRAGCARVFLRQESVRQEVEAADRAGEDQNAQGDRRYVMAHRPSDEARVGAHEPAFLVHVPGRAQEVGGQHRRYETRNEQREEHGRRDHEAELLEVLPGDAAHEGDRREDGDDGGGDGDDGEADLVGRFERGAVGRFPHAHVAHDVLDLDDRVVDEDAGDDGDREQAHEVRARSPSPPWPRRPE